MKLFFSIIFLTKIKVLSSLYWYHQGCQDHDLDLEIVQSRASPSLRRVGAVRRSKKTAERRGRV